MERYYRYTTYLLCLRSVKRLLRPMMKKRVMVVSLILALLLVLWVMQVKLTMLRQKRVLLVLLNRLAREVASRGITVNTVAPGFIDTDMTQTLTDEQKEGIFSQVPANRLGKPEEIANAVAFLASDAAAYITGETLHVNGGMYMI